MTLSAVHEGYLIALIVICVLQFVFSLTRLSALRNRVAASEREQFALQQEVAQLQQDRESLEIVANYDTLTGLPNRRNFEEQLGSALDAACSHRQLCALLMIDYDHFKSINDRFGHRAGDDVLKTLAAQLRDSLTRSDRLSRAVCARYGGDEFSVILPGLGACEANQFAEELRIRIETLHLEFQGIHCPLTISIGVAACPAHTQEPGALLELADQALFRAKAGGRNRVCQASGG